MTGQPDGTITKVARSKKVVSVDVPTSSMDVERAYTDARSQLTKLKQAKGKSPAFDLTLLREISVKQAEVNMLSEELLWARKVDAERDSEARLQTLNDEAAAMLTEYDAK